MNWLEQLNNDLQELYKTRSTPLGNHFELYYESKTLPEITTKLPEWLNLWASNKNNEWLVAGDYIKFYVDNKLVTYEDINIFIDNLYNKINKTKWE